VEGRPSLTSDNDHGDHRFQISENFARGNPQEAKPDRFQIGLTQPIYRCHLAARMNVTIDLDEQPFGHAGKIDDIATDRVLPTKLETTRSRAKSLPKQNLR